MQQEAQQMLTLTAWQTTQLQQHFAHESFTCETWAMADGCTQVTNKCQQWLANMCRCNTYTYVKSYP